MRLFRFLLVPVATLLATPVLQAQQLVAPTEARSPEEERKSFKLPLGFEAQLVAAEPGIAKPMQLAFDAKGRIWVTTSYHYPFAAEKGKASDKLFVLSDFGDDGKAKKIEIFDDKLNIPIGILPLPDCKSCIVSSVGEILKLTDTDGDGKADKREVLFTGFGFKDTHGMTNSFTMMPDGWVYACHGFANESHVRAAGSSADKPGQLDSKGKDGHEIQMHSGHTFRFRPDPEPKEAPLTGSGSSRPRIEVYTRGQVNPFGMAVDPWFNLYTADCHSKPITQLIKGAYYDSFGKPHDGLGYAPHVTRHDHGSTGLCGLAWYEADHFPKEWNGVMFLGNVVTNRINVDRIQWKGSTPVAKELPDFLVSSDPWFRPVDIKLGPDGALYVSDFYNKIIGHYEVDLKHPQRDKDRGRIWRIVWTGEVSRDAKRSETKPVTIADRATALKSMADPSPHRVRNAVDYLADHPQPDAILPLAKFIPNIPAEDTHLRHAARIALRNTLVAVPSQEPLAELLKEQLNSKEPSAKVYDDVFLGVPSANAGWWLSERLKTGTLDAAFTERAYQQIGRYGTEGHREVAWVSAQNRKEMPAIIMMLKALQRGVQTAGTSFKPSDSPQLVSQIQAGLRSSQDTVVLPSLELAGLLKQEATETARELLRDTQRSEAVRLAAFALIEQQPKEVVLSVGNAILADEKSPPLLKEKAISHLVTSRNLADLLTLGKQLQTAPYRQCVTIAVGLAGSAAGNRQLFAALKLGQASPRLLQEKAVLDRLKATDSYGWQVYVREFTAGLPSADARLAALIKERGDGFKKAKFDLEAGKKLFTTACANCHQIGGQGAKIGPQLDGIGNRGVERLLEDTLDPNRNVDHAFHATILDMKDGRQLTGLLRVEGKSLIVIDAQAKETRVNLDDVEKKRTLPMSPMPSDIAEKLKPQEFYDMLGYLASLRNK